MAEFTTLTLSRVRRLTPDAVELCMSLPEADRRAFAFQAGQYITLRHQAGGKEVRRAYSLSCAPGGPELCVGIKQVVGGVFSTFANTQLKVGDTLEVMAPEGRFVFDPSGRDRHLVLIAAGSGVTPIMSILRTALEQTEDARVVLIYGNRSADDAMYLEDIHELLHKYSDRFFCYLTFSRQQEPGALFGRIEKGTLNFVLKNKHAGEAFQRYYLCGPEEMIRTAEAVLLENGVAQSAILHELFTSTATEDAGAAIREGQAQVHVLLDDQDHSFTMDRKDFILDAALKHKVDAPYSCQGGVCSTCIARVVEGSAQMAKNQILTDSEIAEGLILTCQAHPTSAIVKIDYDDV